MLRRPQVILGLSVVLCAVIAVLNSTARYQNSDALVPVFVSLFRWTPFYPGSSYFGMLVPLLTSWLDNPLATYLIQNILDMASLFSAMLLIAAFIYGPRYGSIVGTASLGSFLLLYGATPTLTAFGSPAQAYAVSLTLCYSGLHLFIKAAEMATPWRWAVRSAAVILSFLSMYVFPETVLTAATVVTVTAWMSRRPSAHPATRTQVDARTSMIWAVLLGIAAGSSVLAGSLATSNDARELTGFLSLESWLRADTARLMLSGAVRWFITPALLGGGFVPMVLLAVASSVLTVRWKALIPVARYNVPIIAAVIVECGVLSRMKWVAQHYYDGHYFFNSFFLMLMLASSAIVIPAADRVTRRPSRGTAVSVCAVALLTVAIVRFGFPSMSKLRSGLAECCGTYASTMIWRDVTHFAGDYWTVWPALFETNRRLYEQGDTRRVWGITARSEFMRDKWDTFDRASNIVAALTPDRAQEWLGRYDILTGPEVSSGALLLFHSIPRQSVVFSPVKPDELDASQPAVSDSRCFLDQVSGQDQGMLNLKGWAFKSSTTGVPGVVFVELHGSGQISYFGPAVRFPRPDVAEAFHDQSLMLSGFSTAWTRRGVAHGEYGVRVWQVNSAQVSQCDTNRPPKIE